MTGFRMAGGPVIPNFGHGTPCLVNNHWFCPSWVRQHWGDTFQPALIQHIELTLMVVGIGLAIAFLLALVTYRRPFLNATVGAGADILYTLPSLALFTILLPITGLRVATIAIPLVAYTLFVLFRNIVAGLRGVPEEVLESARGMGLTRRQTFLRVELPLATPAIMAGIRVATVSTISIATIGAFFINYGLGKPIFDALQIADIFRTELVTASALTILLALSADFLLAFVQRRLTPWSRIR